MIWEMLDPRMTIDHLGLIPWFLDPDDPRSAKDQIHANYGQGGGWRPFEGFKLTEHGLKYPGDPLMKRLAQTKLRDEVIAFHDCSWVAIIQPDGSYEVARVD